MNDSKQHGFILLLLDGVNADGITENRYITIVVMEKVILATEAATSSQDTCQTYGKIMISGSQ
jgi:hypothetical protein